MSGEKICTTDGKPPAPGMEHGTPGVGAPQPVGANGQHGAYWVLCESERANGFVRPVRRSYKHVGIPGPRHGPLVNLTAEQAERYTRFGFVKWEAYPESGSPTTGRYWTQEQLDAVGKGCGTVTTMGLAIAETYARKPSFYGATMCVGCGTHLPVGADGEFMWDGTHERVGT